MAVWSEGPAGSTVRRGALALRNRIRRSIDPRSSSGYTLMELMLVMGLLSIVMGALITSFTSALTYETKSFTRATNEETARLALDRLRMDIHCGVSVQAPWQNVDGGWSIQINEDNNPATGCPGIALAGAGVQWCTVRIASNRWQLYRDNVNDCGPTGSLFMVDYVVNPDIWTTSTQVAACIAGQQQWIDVNLLINAPPNKPQDRYTLNDRITMRNSPRYADCGGF